MNGSGPGEGPPGSLGQRICRHRYLIVIAYRAYQRPLLPHRLGQGPPSRDPTFGRIHPYWLVSGLHLAESRPETRKEDVSQPKLEDSRIFGPSKEGHQQLIIDAELGFNSEPKKHSKVRGPEYPSIAASIG